MNREALSTQNNSPSKFLRINLTIKRKRFSLPFGFKKVFMVLYFSGTGNTKFVAEALAEKLNDEIIDVGKRLKNGDFSPINSCERIVVAAPTYAWRIPKIVNGFIQKVEFIGAKNVWFVMTCGGEIGNSAKYNARVASQKGLNYMGTAQVLMPDNYIVMFKSPDKTVAKERIQNAEQKIAELAETIIKGKSFLKPRSNLYDKFMSGAVNGLFYKCFVKAKGFYVTDSCVSCGKCEALCPLNNIKLTDKKPVWGKNCTHCMACISYCPAKAIEYGKKTAKKERYTFEAFK